MVTSKPFKHGDVVMLKHGKSRASAYVTAHYAHINGGVRLDRPLDGLRSWNQNELKRSNAKPRPSLADRRG